MQKSFDESSVINYRVNQFPMQLSRLSNRSFENAFLGFNVNKQVFMLTCVFLEAGGNSVLEFPLLRP